jgi:HEAT repeat protein
MFRFDLISFLIGLIVGLGLAAILYRQRAAVGQLAQRLRQRARQLLEQLSANVESRYQAALRAWLDQLNLMRAHAEFDRLYVDQRLDPPLARPTLVPADAAPAPTSISLSAALRSTPHLAVLGNVGSGRTTLLVKLARAYLGKQAVAVYGVKDERLPLFVHLAEIDWAAASDDNPLAVLLPAATAHVPRLIASNVNRLLNGRIRSNTAILLLDGFDELSPALRTRCAAWLSALVKQQPDLPIVITAACFGYGPLQDCGFASLQLAAWTKGDIDRLAQRWIELVGGGQQDRQVLAAGLYQLDDLSPSPLDMAIAAGLWRAHTALPPKRLAAYEQWIDDALRTGSGKELLELDKLKNALAHLAWGNYQEQRFGFSFETIEQAIVSVLPAGPVDEQVRRVEQATDVARDLVDRTGLIVPFSSDGWMFTQPRLAAYLAAWHAVQTNASLEAYWEQPAWADVFELRMEMSDPAEFVTRELAAADDIGRRRLWTAARWTGYASPEAAWRSKVLGEVARALLQPDQFPPLRQRALHGLLATHDKGLAYLFKRSLSHLNPQVRQLSLYGLARLQREADLPVFNAALADQTPEVRAEAIRSIGVLAHTGSTPATELLIKILIERDEDSRRLAAEMLADCGEEGHQILREGTGEEDIKVRRSAAYGLAATGQAWARDLLQKLERDDKQWYVRSAATDALSLMQARARKPTEDPVVDLSSIAVEQQGWLVEWAAAQGIGIGVGRQANAALLRALDEGQTPVRLAALQTLRHVGDLSHHDKLRVLFYDPEPTVREAAFAALEAIGQRAGQWIPR